MITVRVYPEEVTLLLDKVPQEVARVLTAKMGAIFDELKASAFEGKPGKFLSPTQMQSGVDVQGGLVIGYLSYEDKDGVYPIAPKNYRFLWSKERNFFAHYVYRHPYPKGANWIEQYLNMSKPWIEAELTAALEEMDI
jgi:hypothetical protein